MCKVVFVVSILDIWQEGIYTPFPYLHCVFSIIFNKILKQSFKVGFNLILLIGYFKRQLETILYSLRVQIYSLGREVASCDAFACGNELTSIKFFFAAIEFAFFGSFNHIFSVVLTNLDVGIVGLFNIA